MAESREVFLSPELKDILFNIPFKTHETVTHILGLLDYNIQGIIVGESRNFLDEAL